VNADHAVSVQTNAGLDDGRGDGDTAGWSLAAMGNGKPDIAVGI